MRTESTNPGLPPEQAQLLLRRVVALYAKEFAENPAPREWLAGFKLTNLGLLESHGLGYCAGKLRTILNADELMDQLTRVGIFEGTGKEHFLGCIVVPVKGPEGAIVDLWGLPTRGGPSRFLPKRPASFWNVNGARLSSALLVTEDPLSGLALMTAGLNNVAAFHPSRGPIGVEILEKHGIQQLFLIVGSDGASSAPAEAQKHNFRPYQPRMVPLPGSTGPLDFLKKFGEKALAEAVVAGINGVVAINVPGMRPRPDGFILPIKDIVYVVIALERTRRSMRAVIRAERGEKKTALTIDFNQLRSRREFIQELARVFGEPATRIEADLGKLQDAADVRLAQPDLLLPDDPVEPVPEGDRREAELLGKDPDLFGIVVRDHRALGIVGETENILLCFLTSVSRKMEDPLAVMFISSFGAGKNTIADKARDLCPPEDQFDASYISGKALFHLPPHAIEHKLVTVTEQEGAKHANYPFRVLVSSKVLNAVVTARDPVSGRLQTERKQVKGPVAVISTSSNPNLDRETLSRYIITANDESREQTLAIREEQRKAQTRDGVGGTLEAQRIYRRHHAYHRLLEPCRVVIPANLEIEFGDDRLCSRRDYPKVLALLKAVAFARQMQKTVTAIGGLPCIEADEYDLKIARPLIRKLFNAAFDELSIPSRNLLVVLEQMGRAARSNSAYGQFNSDGRFVFTRRQVREQQKWSKTSVQRCVTELEEYEFIHRDAVRQRPIRYVLDWESSEGSTDDPAKVQPEASPEVPVSESIASEDPKIR